MITANRHIAATALNHSSSRSNTIFRIYIQSSTKPSESVLNFVDLAGSETLEAHESRRANDIESSSKKNSNEIGRTVSQVKSRNKESKVTNRSLFFLTQVITMKAKGSS